ncbi:hypothetical protein [Mesorhizobium sp. IMUNJ 23232]|uniref:hypothetical protein n=1 Tax=Mesorhizobium sp. IMUNJ 23232 TaxID=3376064 RepID=UPI00379C5BC9
MDDWININRQERPDGMILYRPVRNEPTYVLSEEQDAEIGKLLRWQVVVGYVAGIPMLVAILSWLSGHLGLPTVLACVGAILTVATPIGLHLERRRKNIIRQAPVSETQIELPEIRYLLASLWSIMPARHRFALRAAPFLMLVSSAFIILKHLFGGFPDQVPPLFSLTLSTACFVLSIPFCWLMVRIRSGRMPLGKG